MKALSIHQPWASLVVAGVKADRDKELLGPGGAGRVRADEVQPDDMLKRGDEWDFVRHVIGPDETTRWYTQLDAAWLRAHRDEVLAALDGELGTTYDTIDEPAYGTPEHPRKWATSGQWLYPGDEIWTFTTPQTETQ